MRVTQIRSVYDPGCHCAFTDIVHWRGRIYVTFREALNHSVHYSGQILVLGSADGGRTFQTHARLAANGHDLRDPHFFTVGDQLGLSIPSWLVPDPARGVETRERTCHLALSDDAIHWQISQPDNLQGHTLWRPETGPDGKLYAAAYAPSREDTDYRVGLYCSTDGRNWDKVSVIHDADRANETDICFLPSGELLALVRRGEEPKRPVLARSRVPYTEWTKVDCDRFLQGPLLVCLPNGELLAVGRSVEPLEPDQPKTRGGYMTRGFKLHPDTGELEYLFTLPSGGDTSYAGYLQIDENRAFLSYYSGHGYENGSFCAGDNPQRCGIYVAKLLME